MWLLAWSFAGWACLDLNQGPLPYQFKDSPRSAASTLLRSSVTVSLMASLCGCVAVTSAVNDHLLRRSGHIVQDRPLRSLCWGDIPHLPMPGGGCPPSWQQVRQQSRHPDLMVLMSFRVSSPPTPLSWGFLGLIFYALKIIPRISRMDRNRSLG